MIETLKDQQRTVLCIKDVLDQDGKINFISGKKYIIEFDGGYIFSTGEYHGNMVGCTMFDKLFQEHFEILE